MPNEILRKEQGNAPAQIIFADHAGDYAPVAANDYAHEGTTPTESQITLTGVVNGAARQSAKVDLGTLRALTYAVHATFEFAATPVVGTVVELYWSSSANNTAASGNGPGITGSDAAFTGTGADLDTSVLDMVFIGAFVCTDDPTATIQKARDIGQFAPSNRWGSLVVKNASGADIHSDDIEIGVYFDPQITEVQ